MKVSKNILLASGAVGLGLFCFFGANYYLRNYLNDAESRLAASYQTRKIIVAKQELQIGTILSADHLAARSVPQRFIPSTALNPDELDSLVGQRTLGHLKPGDPIDKNTLERIDNAAFSTTLDKGERAITFPVDEISSISGMLMPGDIIDLMYSGNVPAQQARVQTTGQEMAAQAKEQMQVRLILQAVPVLATGKTTRKKMVKADDGSQHEVNQDFTTVTLKVSPQNSQQILLAQKLGQLTAILRNPEDKQKLGKLSLDESSFKQTAKTSGASVDFIIGGMGQVNLTKIPIPENATFDLLKSDTKPAPAPANAMDIKNRPSLNPAATEANLPQKNEKNG